MLKPSPASSAAHRQPIPARPMRWPPVRPGSPTSIPSLADKANATAADLDQRPDVLHLDDSSVITSRRAQSPLQNQAHTARWQGLQTGQDTIIQPLGKGVTPARLVAE